MTIFLRKMIKPMFLKFYFGETPLFGQFDELNLDTEYEFFMEK